MTGRNEDGTPAFPRWRRLVAVIFGTSDWQRRVWRWPVRTPPTVPPAAPPTFTTSGYDLTESAEDTSKVVGDTSATSAPAEPSGAKQED
jgi:hypothetical protein